MLDEIAAVWRNVAGIEMSLDSSALARLDRDAVAAEQIVEVVREAISNAVRHGRANLIAVEVTATNPADIEVVVDDNGAFALEQGRGMGTEIMQGLTRWLRWEPSPLGGTRVTCLIASERE
jgi:nitrate/nitrite-specific signal transduction histidine kinase